MKKNEKKTDKLMHIMYYIWLFFTITYSDTIPLYGNICAVVIMGIGAFYLLYDKRLVVHQEIIWLTLFVCFGFCSLVWSPIPTYTLTRALTLLKLLVFLVLFVTYIDKTNDVKFVLTGLEIVSNITAIYTIYRYGISGLRTILITSGQRVGGEFVNENTLGLFLATGIIVTLFNVICFGDIKRLLLAIIPFGVSLMTASRKVIIIIPTAVLVIFFMKMKAENAVSNKMKTIFILLLVLVAGIFIFQTPLADTLRIRLSTMIGSNSFIDYSARNRYRMIDLGIEIFKHHPVLGVGLNGSLVYANGTYLHSNYIELLATGGIVGILIYYAYYIYVFSRLCKKKTNNIASWKNIGILFLVICLITDVGAVTYFSKPQCIYFVIFAIAIGKNSSRSIME